MAWTIQDKMWETAQKMPEEWREPFVYAMVRYGFTGEMPDESEPWYLVLDAYTDRIELSRKKSRSGRSGGMASGRARRHASEADGGRGDDEERTDREASESRADVENTSTDDGAECFGSKNAVENSCFGTEKESEKEKEKECECEIETEPPSPATSHSDVDEFSTPGVTVVGMDGIQGSGKGRVPLACMRRSEDGRAFFGFGDERLFRTQVEALHDRYREVTGRDDFREYVRRVDGLCPKACRGDPERAAQCFEVMCRAIDQWDSRKAPRGPFGLTRAMLAGVAGREG